MDELEDREEELFKKMMSKSELKMPFSDFEDIVMIEIEKKEVRHATITKDIKISWVFFLIGSVFGIAISILLPLLENPVLGVRPEILAITFQLTFVIIFFTQIEVFIKLLKKN